LTRRVGSAGTGAAMCLCAWACTGGPDVPEDSDTAETGDTAETDDTGGDTDPLADATLVVGSGVFSGQADCTGFVAVDEGSDLAIVRGPQGGWHVDVSIRGTGLPELADLSIRMVDTQTGTPVMFVDPLRLSVRLISEDGPTTWNGDGCYLGVQAILDFAALGATPPEDTPWTALTGRTMRTEVTLSAEGRSLSDTLTFVMQPDPCDADLTAPGCLCDPESGFRPGFCDASDTDTDTDDAPG